MQAEISSKHCGPAPTCNGCKYFWHLLQQLSSAVSFNSSKIFVWMVSTWHTCCRKIEACFFPLVSRYSRWTCWLLLLGIFLGPSPHGLHLWARGSCYFYNYTECHAWKTVAMVMYKWYEVLKSKFLNLNIIIISLITLHKHIANYTICVYLIEY